MTVSANEVKIKGVSVFDNLLSKVQEVIINVRGKDRFVVVDIERYKELRALELDAAYEQSLEDIKNVRYKKLSAKEHLEELQNAIQNNSDR